MDRYNGKIWHRGPVASKNCRIMLIYAYLFDNLVKIHVTQAECVLFYLLVSACWFVIFFFGWAIRDPVTKLKTIETWKLVHTFVYRVYPKRVFFCFIEKNSLKTVIL